MFYQVCVSSECRRIGTKIKYVTNIWREFTRSSCGRLSPVWWWKEEYFVQKTLKWHHNFENFCDYFDVGCSCMSDIGRRIKQIVVKNYIYWKWTCKLNNFLILQTYKTFCCTWNKLLWELARNKRITHGRHVNLSIYQSVWALLLFTLLVCAFNRSNSVCIMFCVFSNKADTSFVVKPWQDISGNTWMIIWPACEKRKIYHNTSVQSMLTF